MSNHCDVVVLENDNEVVVVQSTENKKKLRLPKTVWNRENRQRSEYFLFQICYVALNKDRELKLKEEIFQESKRVRRVEEDRQNLDREERKKSDERRDEAGRTQAALMSQMLEMVKGARK
jgi:hypothetical protein